MTLNKERVNECCAVLAMALNTEDDSEYEFEGQKIKLSQFVPVLFKHLVRIIMKNPDKSEEILQYIVEAIHYSREFTDEPPEVEMMNKQEYDRHQNNFHDEPKVKI